MRFAILASCATGLVLSPLGAAHAQDCEMFVRHEVTLTDGAWAVVAADLDGDGDLDVLSASGDYAHWYEHLAGGVFGPQQLLYGGGNVDKVVAIDLDADDDLDVVTGDYDVGHLERVENLGGGLFGPATTIGSGYVSTLEAADLDGDGDDDLLAAGATPFVGWYENLGNGTVAVYQTLWSAGIPSAAHAADLDGDGDLDVIFGYSFPYELAVVENLGGGVFAPANGVAAPLDAPYQLDTSDLDGDGDLDVLAAYNNYANEVAWYENLGGGAFGGQQALSGINDAMAVLAADFDQDGDNDPVSAGQYSRDISWYRNLGAGSFAPQELVFDGVPTSEEMLSLDAADLDGDGDLDLIAGSWSPGVILWFANQGGDADGDGFGDTCELALAVPPTGAGQPFVAVVTHAVPGELVELFASKGPPAPGPCPPQLGGLCMDLGDPRRVTSAVADASGVANFGASMPALAPAGGIVSFQVVARRAVVDAEKTRPVSWTIP